MKLFINDNLLGNDVLYCHKAPGTDYFDYSQYIHLPTPLTLKSSIIKPADYPCCHQPAYPYQDYVCPTHPCGSVLKIQLMSSWGDPSYIGLDRIRLYSPDGAMIVVDIHKVFACPSSVNVIKRSGEKPDPRTIDKLFKVDPNDPADSFIPSSHRSWLAPISYRNSSQERQGLVNFIYIVFDRPVVLGCMKFWNYHKSPARGVRGFSLWLDNNLLFSGEIQRADKSACGQSILFTSNPQLVEREKENIYHAPVESMVFVDNYKVLCVPNEQILNEFRSSAN